jgi:hypothetical protein
MKYILLFSIIFLSFSPLTRAQHPGKEESKVPYKVLTEGNRITLKSTIKIRKILVWTASGHRIAEDHNLDTYSWTYRVTIDETIFFMMVETADGKRTTKKIGLRQ